MSSAIEKLEEIAERAGVRVSKRAALTLLALLLIAGAITVYGSVSNRSAEDGSGFEVHEGGAEQAPGGTSAESISGSTSASAVETQTVFVHVVGAVMRPGVYELAADARVQEAVVAAGGCLASAAPQGINLARGVADGEQLVVPTQDEWEAGGASAAVPTGEVGAGAGGISQGGVVNLNTADVVALETLPGVGPATAAKIVDEREANGPFQSVEDLARVSGIGSKKIEAIRDLVTVG